MNALIELCRRLGVRLRVEGGALAYDAPKGAVTSELAAALKAHKPEILAALTKPDPIPSPPHSAIDLNLAASYDDPALAPFDAAYRRKAAAEPGYEPGAEVLLRVREPRGGQALPCLGTDRRSRRLEARRQGTTALPRVRAGRGGGDGTGRRSSSPSGGASPLPRAVDVPSR